MISCNKTGRMSLLAVSIGMVLVTAPGSLGAISEAKDSSLFNLQMNGDVVPSALFGDDSGWTTDGDILTMNNDGAGMFGWNGVLSRETGYTWEVRFRMVEPDPAVDQILVTIVGDGSGATNSYHILTVTDLGTIIPDSASSGLTPLTTGQDFSDGFHVLRSAQEANSSATSIWLNGELLTESHGERDNALNELLIGASSGSFNGSVVEYDYARVDTTGAFAPIPEPASVALLGAGALFLLRRRR